jgi:hypothetical protein
MPCGLDTAAQVGDTQRLLLLDGFQRRQFGVQRVDLNHRRFARLAEDEQVLLVIEHVLEQLRAGHQLAQGQVVAQQFAKVIEPRQYAAIGALEQGGLGRFIQVHPGAANADHRHQGEGQGRAQRQAGRASGSHGRTSQT